MRPTFTFRSILKLYPGVGGWHFATMDRKTSSDIRSLFSEMQSVGGSLRVNATIGRTTWPTSLFWSRTGHYMLAVKADVRKREGVQHGDRVDVTVEIRDV